MDASNTVENSIKNSIRQLSNVVVCAECVGRYNLCALIIDHDIDSLNGTVSKIRNFKGVNNVSVNIWTENRHMDFARDLAVMGKT